MEKYYSGDFSNKIAIYNDPMYPYCQSQDIFYNSTSLREIWEPTFKSSGVKFVIENGRRGFKRTKPVYDNKVDLKEGIVYVGEGDMTMDKAVKKCP